MPTYVDQALLECAVEVPSQSGWRRIRCSRKSAFRNLVPRIGSHYDGLERLTYARFPEGVFSNLPTATNTLSLAGILVADLLSVGPVSGGCSTAPPWHTSLVRRKQ